VDVEGDAFPGAECSPSSAFEAMAVAAMRCQWKLLVYKAVN
jgi:hypothetical protein